MGQVLHASAATSEAVRRAIQHRQASLRVLAKRYGVNTMIEGRATAPVIVPDTGTASGRLRASLSNRVIPSPLPRAAGAKPVGPEARRY